MCSGRNSTANLFILERISRISSGGLPGVISDRQHRNHENYGTGSNEYQRIQIGFTREILQPVFQKEICYRPGKQTGNNYQLYGFER